MKEARALDYGFLCGYAWRWGFWFRVRGYGPHVARDRLMLFSERHGYRKILRIGRWSFEWLKPT